MELKEKLAGMASKEERQKIRIFLSKGFSVKGRIVFYRIFLLAKEQKVPVDRVLKECERQWDAWWAQVDIKSRADIDARGVWFGNRHAFIQICRGAGIVLPEMKQQS